MATVPSLKIPEESHGPARRLVRRLVVALALMAFVTLVAYLGRDGYRDGDEVGMSFMDAVYYATVSITTTGYGDITPVSDGARLATTLLITPARILFLIILVGTTLEVLAEGSRAALRERSWRRHLNGHTIICGYGTKGRSAIESITGHGTPKEKILVVDPDPASIEEANRAGLAGIVGDATRASVLLEAGVKDAAAVIVAPHRDDAAVLMTLTAREHNTSATIVTAVREDENRHLMHQSGADSVITSSAASGRLLGFATHSPKLVEVLEDLLEVGSGLDVEERLVPDGPAVPLAEITGGNPLMAVIRGSEIIRFDDVRCREVGPGDRVVVLTSIPD